MQSLIWIEFWFYFKHHHHEVPSRSQISDVQIFLLVIMTCLHIDPLPAILDANRLEVWPIMMSVSAGAMPLDSRLHDRIMHVADLAPFLTDVDLHK